MSITTKDAVVALLERQLCDLKEGAVPVEDFYIAHRDTYRFDIDREDAESLLRTLRQKNRIRKV